MVALGYLGKLSSDRAKFPHVVGYIVIGLILGRSFLNVVSHETYMKVEILSVFALAMVGFTVGGELRYNDIKELGKTIPVITLFEAGTTAILVFTGVFLFTKDLPTAIILGALAAATDAAATVNVLWQYRSRGPLTKTIFAVVGLDDAAALMIYAFASSYTKMMVTHQDHISLLNLVGRPILEITGSLAIGVAVGFLMDYIIKVMPKRSDILIITLAGITICAGIARTFHLSMILTCMALGVTLINISPKNRAAFDVLDRFTTPFYVLLFVMVGAHLDISALPHMGILGLIYILCRVSGKISGAWAGSSISKADNNVRKYLGSALLPQAGVAIGLAIEASHSLRFMGPEGAKLATLIMNVITATVFIFEIVGPAFVKMAIFKAGEAREKPK